MTKKPVVQGGVDNYLGKQPQVVAPRKWQSSPDAPPTELAYITKAEKELILKKDIHGSLDKGPNMGPSGIMSLDSFGDIGGAGAAGVDTAASGGANPGAGFSGRGPNETKSDFDSRVRNQREIIQKAEQRQAERLGYRERRNISDFKAKRGPFGIGSLISGLLGFINPALGLISRGITSIPGAFQTFKQSKTLADFYNNMKNKTSPTGIDDDDDDTTLLDQVSPDLPFAKSYLQSLQPTTVNVTGTNYPGANQLTGVNNPNQLDDDLLDLEQGVEPGFSPLQARDGGRIQYMDGGLTDLVDIYD
ncbi:hypothetical protein [Hyphomonas sp.]|uniref:hypothetical protein n=1 Tax=Hyphomonas sp. TaxID=87 RepID=UPI000C8E30CF|nr:hypothetical protein [Hyphomonas sp.]MAL47044.1 hypothetical protein [Hyphomonas sp.]